MVPQVPEDVRRNPANREASEPAGGITRLFFGPLGLRAGWGMSLFVVLAVLLTSLLAIAIASLSGQGRQLREVQRARAAEAQLAKKTGQSQPVREERVSLDIIGEAALAGGFLLAALVLSRLEHRRFGVYGLGRAHLPDAVHGAAWGLVIMGALVGALWALHALVFERRLLGGAAAFKYGVSWLLFFLLVGVSEEFSFRGYLQFTLMRGLLGLSGRMAPLHARLMAFCMAALLGSVVFFFAHTGNTGETPFGLAGVFLAGLLFSYTLWRTGSLWWGVGFHVSWDWAQSFLFGVPDSGTVSAGRLFSTHAAGSTLLSGGAAGPEGSALMIPALFLAFLTVRLRPEAVQPAVEPDAQAMVTVVPHSLPPRDFA